MTLSAEQERVQREFGEACKPAPFPAVQRTGIALGVPAEEYHRRELYVASKSALDRIDRSPAHYLAWLHGEADDDSPALRFGTAFHMALLEPLRYQAHYVTPPKFSGKGSVKAKEDWLAAHPGTVISESDREAITGMLASVRAHPAASRLILEGTSEVTLRWLDEITGLRCKSRADYWVKGKRLCVDVKTTEDASPEAFSKSVHKYGYATQDALYRAGFAACGAPIEHFAILAVEKSPPYATAVYVLDAAAVAHGFDRARQGIDRLHRCVKENRWPAYADGVETLALPPWVTRF